MQKEYEPTTGGGIPVVVAHRRHMQLSNSWALGNTGFPFGKAEISQEPANGDTLFALRGHDTANWRLYLALKGEC